MITGGTAPLAAIGRREAGLLLAESAIGTISGNLSAGKRFEFQSLNITDEVDKIEVLNKRQDPNIAAHFLGKRSSTFACEAYINPAAAGVAPDVRAFFLGAQMGETIVGGTSVTYACNNTLVPFAILRDVEIASQLAHGCIVETLTLSGDGTGASMMSAAGRASYAVRTGTTTLSANEAAAQTVLSVTDASVFEVGGYIQVGADNNSGNGYRVTAVDTVADEITVTPGLVTGASNNDVVAPIIPTGSVAGSPVSGIIGSATVGGAAIEITGYSVTIANEFTTNQEKYGAASYDRAMLADRRVEGSLTCFGTRSNLLRWIESRQIGTQAIVINVGDTAPRRMEIALPYSQLMVANLDVPETEQVMFELPFKALKSTGNDELTVKYY
jgi:hypothetical protein